MRILTKSPAHNCRNNTKSESQNSVFSPSPSSPPTASPGANQLEMLLERAKAFQQSNPSLNSFPGFPGIEKQSSKLTESQGQSLKWNHTQYLLLIFEGQQGFPGLRSGLFPAPLPGQMTNLDALTNRWRSSLPANIQEPETVQADQAGSSSVSPGPGSPVKDRPQSPERPVSSGPSNSVTNGGSGGSKAASEAGTLSPRHTDSSSPMKSDTESPARELAFPSGLGPGLGPLSPYSAGPHPALPADVIEPGVLLLLYLLTLKC